MNTPGSFVTSHHPPASGADAAPVLLLLHGTGGDENSLVRPASVLAPGAHLLGIRGKVLEHGALRFFPRMGEGVFDARQVTPHVDELAAALPRLLERHGLAGRKVAALGYSNGANMVHLLLALHGRLLDAAVLWRPMVVLTPARLGDLSGVSVLVAAGVSDPYGGVEHARRLEAMLTSAGASVRVSVRQAGHELTPDDMAEAQDFLRESLA